jgi:hypothetical protein
MTTQSVKSVTPTKRHPPVKQSAAQAVRVKKRRNKRVDGPAANGDLQQVKTLKAAMKPLRPLASFAGMWATDETFDEFVTAIAVNRQAVDADVSQP